MTQGESVAGILALVLSGSPLRRRNVLSCLLLLNSLSCRRHSLIFLTELQPDHHVVVVRPNGVDVHNQDFMRGDVVIGGIDGDR